MQFNEATGVMEVTACPAGEICPFVFSGNSTCESVGELEIYPGDYCATNTNCTSGICDLGLCINLQEPNCTNVYDCSPGLYCNLSSLYCEPQRIPGESCMFEYDCENDSTCVMGVCVEYFSLGVGEAVDFVEDRNTGLTLACASGFSAYSSAQHINLCALAPKTTKFPAKCQPDSMCEDSSQTYKAPCICSYGNGGYCPPFPGDPPVLQFIQIFQQITTLNAACNTFSRFRFTCFGQSSPEVRNLFNEFQVQYTLIMDGLYPLTMNAESCVANTLLSDYVAMQEVASTNVTQVCEPFDCNYQEEMEANDQCVFYELETAAFQYLNPTVHLAACLNETDVCTVVKASNSTCEPPLPTRYPGDYCETHMDCISSNCGSNMCQGFVVSNNCSNVYDCNPGSYCDFDTLFCTAQKTLGQSCLTEYECANHLGCNMGICTVYFSVSNGNFIDGATEDGFSTLCASGFAYMGECQPPPTSKTPPPSNCTFNTECESSIPGVVKLCTCGYNPAGQSLCPLFLGDTVPQVGLASMKKLVAFNHICNTFSRFSEGCFLRNNAALGPYYIYASAMLNYTMFATIQYNEDCLYSTLARNILQTWSKAKQHNFPQPKPQPDKDEDGSSRERLGLGVLLLWTVFEA